MIAVCSEIIEKLHTESRKQKVWVFNLLVRKETTRLWRANIRCSKRRPTVHSTKHINR